MEISNRSDAELVEEALQGRIDSFNALIRRWEKKVYGYLVHLTGRQEDSFDLCQEVFLAVYRNMQSLKNGEKFAPWLFRIAHNSAYSFLRSQHTLAPASEPVESPDASPRVLRREGQAWERIELKLLVEKMLNTLPVEQREVIILKMYQGFKFDEIAEIQKCPSSTVKTRLYTALDQMRSQMGEPGGDSR